MWLTIVVTIIFIAAIAIIYRHFSALRVINYYAQQGITVFPGARNFFLGNARIVGEWEALRLASQDEGSPVIKSTFNWILDQLDGSGKEGNYDAAENPVVLLNFVGQLQILIADPVLL